MNHFICRDVEQSLRAVAIVRSVASVRAVASVRSVASVRAVCLLLRERTAVNCFLRLSKFYENLSEQAPVLLLRKIREKAKFCEQW